MVLCLHLRRECPLHDRKFLPHCSHDLLVPDVGAVQRRNCTLRGGDVLSHVAVALAGCPEVHAPCGASRVVPEIDKPIPVKEHEQVSVDM